MSGGIFPFLSFRENPLIMFRRSAIVCQDSHSLWSQSRTFVSIEKRSERRLRPPLRKSDLWDLSNTESDRRIAKGSRSDDISNGKVRSEVGSAHDAEI